MQALCNQGRHKAQGRGRPRRCWVCSACTVAGLAELCEDTVPHERGCTQALRRHGGLGGTRRCSVDSGSCPPQKRASIASGRGKTLPSAKRQGFWVENSPVGGCAALRAVHSRSMPEPCLRGGFFPCQRITDALSFWKAVPISPWVFVARTLFLNT